MFVKCYSLFAGKCLRFVNLFLLYICIYTVVTLTHLLEARDK